MAHHWAREFLSFLRRIERAVETHAAKSEANKLTNGQIVSWLTITQRAANRYSTSAALIAKRW
jgi:hypothetical protein